MGKKRWHFRRIVVNSGRFFSPFSSQFSRLVHTAKRGWLNSCVLSLDLLIQLIATKSDSCSNSFLFSPVPLAISFFINTYHTHTQPQIKIQRNSTQPDSKIKQQKNTHQKSNKIRKPATTTTNKWKHCRSYHSNRIQR